MLKRSMALPIFNIEVCENCTMEHPHAHIESEHLFKILYTKSKENII